MLELCNVLDMIKMPIQRFCSLRIHVYVLYAEHPQHFSRYKDLDVVPV